MKFMSRILALCLFLSLNAKASDFIKNNRHEATRAELQKVKGDASQFITREYSNTTPDWRPAEDYANFKYILISSEAGFSEAANLRYTIAQNLPEGVKLVLLVTHSNAESVKQTYSKYISPDRIILAKDTNIAGGFWARDAFPYPVVNSRNQLSLVGARYYRPFNSSPALATSLNLNMSKNNFTFVGGNLIADENGTCFTINSERRFTTTENDLRNVYGCKDVKILRHVSGIGDVDEVLKPIGNNTILTNTAEYVNDLKAWGYTVVMLPDVPNSYRTYVNSLMVGKTVFMPIYGISKDAEAKKVYESLGYKVFGIASNTLSDQMHGSVHCQTMAYPAVDETVLLSALGLQKIELE
jgi:agmatine/peptidylarginine deiminase